MKKADRRGEKPERQIRSLDDAAAAPQPLHGVMPESDPAYRILSGILRVVPTSCWAFGRVQANGELDSLFGSHANGKQRAALAEELRRQAIKAPRGPRIAATLELLDAFSSGITLIFADARAHFGILTLLRNAELGPFTASDISMLTFALDALSDRLSVLRLQQIGGNRRPRASILRSRQRSRNRVRLEFARRTRASR